MRVRNRNLSSRLRVRLAAVRNHAAGSGDFERKTTIPILSNLLVDYALRGVEQHGAAYDETERRQGGQCDVRPRPALAICSVRTLVRIDLQS